MASVEHTDLLTGLNPEQLKAVKENDKPLLIIAGAGSGKTRVITTKVASLIQSGVKPENILALTFTQKAAEEMLSRVCAAVGDIYDLQISTFHAFCNTFLRDNLLETRLNADFKVISDTAQLVFFAKNVNTFGLEHIEFGGNPYTLAEEAKKFVARCKDESLAPSDIQRYVEEQSNKTLTEEERDQLEDIKDMLKMFKSYEAYKLDNNMVDYGDMLYTVHDILSKNTKILKEYQQRFRYVLVDEFQDTNYVQLQIVNLLAKEHRRICVVGDDDQSIYRFRGAYVTNISEFKSLFPDYVEVTIGKNYRSTKNILAVANKLIANKPDGLVKNLVTDNQEGEAVSVIECNTNAAQTSYVVDRIAEIAKSRPLGDIAVLCRSRASAVPIGNELKKRQVPYQFLGFSDFFSEAITKDIVALLRVVSDPEFSNGALVRVLERDPYRLKRTEVARLGNLAHEKMCSFYDAFEYIDTINVDIERFRKVKESIDGLIAAKNKLTVKDFVHEILFGHEFYSYEIKLDNKKNISLLNQFYALTEDFTRLYLKSSLSDFVSYIDYASGFEMEEEGREENAVKLMTVHSAKGKEFPVVFVIDAVERKFPVTLRRDKFPIPEGLLKGQRPILTEEEMHVHEERRLMYVAMTRAKEKLFITYAKRYNENVTDSKPSRFLAEIEFKTNPHIRSESVTIEGDDLSVQDIEDESVAISKEILSDLRDGRYNSAIEKALLLAKKRDADVPAILRAIKEPDYSKLEEEVKNELDHTGIITEDFLYSVSQFNTYERCPRAYQYHYVYRIPTAPKPYFDFGGAIHSVIEELTKKIKGGEQVDLPLALEILKRVWSPRGFESKLDEKRALEEAEEILKVFLEEQARIRSEIVEIEKEFTIKVGDFQVRGRIDRIDRVEDEFMVIDYKTSKEALSEKKLREDMQLLAYTLVVESLFYKRPKKVGWWFLRANKKVMIEVSEEDVKKISDKMSSIVASIKGGDFHPTPGWVCKNCDFKTICDVAKI